MASANKPTELTLRAYQVGFGDCFLLTFHYTNFDRHLLIDFGTTGLPKGLNKESHMLRVAEDIRKVCTPGNGGGEPKLHAVVATHRHADHISGFATKGNDPSSGQVIADLKPDVIVQPWTEHPKADPVTGKLTRANAKSFAFASTLQNMHAISAAVLVETQRRQLSLGKELFRELSFLGEDNIANRSAVENLMRMGKRRGAKATYVHYRTKSGLEKVLPGVKITVLGPPSLKQTETVRKQRSKDKDEFWHFTAFAEQMVVKQKSKIFPAAKTYSALRTPPFTRWFISRMKSLRGEQMLSIMRALDKVMNNTSIILLFEVGGKKLLFPGDAQIENWAYALGKPQNHKLLSDVDLYKVGHHASLNATPKTLWNLFKNRSTKKTPSQLVTVVSTMPGKHGKTANETEVPRRPLVEALKKESDYHTTQDIKSKDGPCEIIKIPV